MKDYGSTIQRLYNRNRISYKYVQKCKGKLKNEEEKNRRYLKKKQTASNNKYNTQSENTPKRLKNRLSTTEEKICEPEYIIIETSQDEVQRETQ